MPREDSVCFRTMKAMLDMQDSLQTLDQECYEIELLEIMDIVWYGLTLKEQDKINLLVKERYHE
jgi:hypothetical protein